MWTGAQQVMEWASEKPIAAPVTCCGFAADKYGMPARAIRVNDPFQPTPPFSAADNLIRLG